MDFASYVSGFVDGEGCFSVSFNVRRKLKTGIEVRPSFSVSQNKRSFSVLNEVRRYFQCGSIRFSNKDQTYKYEVRSIRDLSRKINPHFKRFPLKTSKQKDFGLFEQICQMILQSKHLNTVHLRKIIEWSYDMNPSGKRKYSKAELLNILDKMKK
jgi:hypothetical protein